MFQKHLINLYARDLNALILEIEKFESNESLLWASIPGISNCSGNLFLHLIGNLNHFFGALILENGFVRQRELEFSDKDIPLKEIKEKLVLLKPLLDKTFKALENQDPDQEFPFKMNQQSFTYLEFIIHLFGHLNYHLGQINYHRRMVFGAL